jgi:uncharacterized membrane protein YagU involved in acid resistance
MSRQFQDLTNGLDEVEAFVAGERTGYEVTLPPEAEVESMAESCEMNPPRHVQRTIGNSS